MALVRWLLIASCVLSSSTHVQARAPESAAELARRKQVLVHGDGIEITVGEIEDALARQPDVLRVKYEDPNELRAFVEGMVRSELLANEAQRRGYEKDAAVRHQVQDSAAQALVRSDVDQIVTPDAIESADVAAYYEAHPADFHRVAMRRASVIVLDSAESAEALLEAAQKADARAFAELAKSRSRDPETKVQGGDLGYFAADPANDPPRDKTQPAVAPALRSEAFTLAEPGSTSKAPVAVGTQFGLVRFTAERPERHVSLADATPSIRAKLWRERRQKALDQLYAQLRAKQKPQVFTDRIYRISFDDMEKRPSGFTPDPVPAAAKAAP